MNNNVTTSVADFLEELEKESQPQQPQTPPPPPIETVEATEPQPQKNNSEVVEVEVIHQAQPNTIGSFITDAQAADSAEFFMYILDFLMGNGFKMLGKLRFNQQAKKIAGEDALQKAKEVVKLLKENERLVKAGKEPMTLDSEETLLADLHDRLMEFYETMEIDQTEQQMISKILKEMTVTKQVNLTPDKKFFILMGIMTFTRIVAIFTI